MTGSEAEQVRGGGVGSVEIPGLGGQGSVEIHGELSDKRIKPQLPSHSQLSQSPVLAGRLSGNH